MSAQLLISRETLSSLQAFSFGAVRRLLLEIYTGFVGHVALHSRLPQWRFGKLEYFLSSFVRFLPSMPTTCPAIRIICYLPFHIARKFASVPS